MATNVFISWSGELSKNFGQALHKWIPAALQNVKPYFTPEDVEKGTKWDSQIAKELQESNVGIICLTRDNLEKPWILFEAGALSKSLDRSRVCTLLFDLEPADVKPPLTTFQATRFNKKDFKRLIITINSSSGGETAQLQRDVLDSVFEMWWPKLEAEVNEIMRSHSEQSQGARRSDRDILEEILELSRANVARSHKGGHSSIGEKLHVKGGRRGMAKNLCSESRRNTAISAVSGSFRGVEENLFLVTLANR